MLNFTFIYVHNFIWNPFFSRPMKEKSIYVYALHTWNDGEKARILFFVENCNIDECAL